VCRDADNCPDHHNPSQSDCDGDGEGDACEIANCDGAATCADCNANGVPDGCEPGDMDGNGGIDLFDLAGLVDCLTGPCAGHACYPTPDTHPCCTVADFDGDEDVDLLDIAAFQGAYTGA
jgi:hypothetical protein